MSKSNQSSVAPKERINIKYVPNTGDQVIARRRAPGLSSRHKIELTSECGALAP